MTNPRCAVCGHVSRVGAAACELCNTQFDIHGPSGAGAAGEPFVSEAEPSGDFGGGARKGALPTDIPSPRFLGVGDAFSPTLRGFSR